MMTYRYLTLLFLFLFVSCSKNSSDISRIDPAVYAKTYTPVFHSVNCSDIDEELENLTNAECGYLEVPESRYSTDNTTFIKLAVTILKSTSETPEPDPMLYLHGGPGHSALFLASHFKDFTFNGALKVRDVILIDQRGSGYSLPSLECPEIYEKRIETLQQLTHDNDSLNFDIIGVNECITRLENDSIDLKAYSSIENANDLNDLREVLSFDSWNVYGVSYGTRLAQTLLRYHPENIRSIILDSALANDDNIYSIESLIRIDELTREILSQCESDTSCNEKYPNIKSRFWEKVSQLNQTPEKLHYKNSEHMVDIQDVSFNGDDLISIMSNLFDQRNPTSIPKEINKLLNSDYSYALNELDKFFDTSNISIGSHSTISCADSSDILSTDNDGLSNIENINSELKNIISETTDRIKNYCSAWPHATTHYLDPSAISSEVPVLLFAGYYDIRTPATSTQKVANSLKNSQYIELPLGRHGFLFKPCAQSMRDEFLADPIVEVDSSCITESRSQIQFSKPSLQSRNAREISSKNLVPLL